MTETRIVVGSGPSSVGVTLALLERGFDVTVLDVGETLDSGTADIVNTMAAQEPQEWSEDNKAAIQRIDFGTDPALPPKRAFGSTFAYHLDPQVDLSPSMRLYGSHAFGGLSTVWGCALLKASRAELSGWPCDT